MQSVHPRVRGEHAGSAIHVGLEHGSSPRSRGTSWGHRRQAWHYRFIPAFAGNIKRMGTSRSFNAVHPRVRGEHLSVGSRHALSGGSSPRSRGTCCAIPFIRAPHRFIPAFAGNIHAYGKSPVHTCGSSPRSRGTLIQFSVWSKNYRFIPAFAGNMLGRTGGRNPGTVHPRVRGEH